jgi:hypothetical protein
MKTMLLTVLIFGLLMAAMAIGVIVQGKRLRGSCGGTGSDCACDDPAREACELKKKIAEAARAKTRSQA